MVADWVRLQRAPGVFHQQDAPHASPPFLTRMMALCVAGVALDGGIFLRAMRGGGGGGVGAVDLWSRRKACTRPDSIRCDLQEPGSHCATRDEECMYERRAVAGVRPDANAGMSGGAAAAAAMASGLPEDSAPTAHCLVETPL